MTSFWDDWNEPDKIPPVNGIYVGHLLIGQRRRFALIGYEDGIWVLGHGDAVLLGWSEISEYRPLHDYETKGEGNGNPT